MKNKWGKRLFPKPQTVLAVPIATTTLSVLFSTGTTLAQATSKPQATADTNTRVTVGFQPTVAARVVETHTIQDVERPVIKVEYVDRIEKVPVELHNYTDLEELKRWITGATINTTTIYFQQPNETVDCDDYALALQQKAIADGYIMSFQIIGPDSYNSLFEHSRLPPDTLHAINLVVIGNSAYYIEPQTGEVVFAARLD